MSEKSDIKTQVLVGIITAVFAGIILLMLEHNTGCFTDRDAVQSSSKLDSSKVTIPQETPPPSPNGSINMPETIRGLAAISDVHLLINKLNEYREKNELFAGPRNKIENPDDCFVFIVDTIQVYGIFLFRNNTFFNFRGKESFKELPKHLVDKQQIWVIEHYKLIQKRL